MSKDTEVSKPVPEAVIEPSTRETEVTEQVEEAASSLISVESESSEERAKEIFRKNPLLVIEDIRGWVERIKGVIRDAGKETNVNFAETGVQVAQVAEKMLASMQGGERFMVISDLQIPFDEDEIAEEFAGVQALSGLQKSVDDWNSQHADKQPIRLEIIMNSSNLNSEQELADFKNRYAKKLNAESIVGGNPENKDKAVDTFLDYLKRTEE